MRNQFFYTDEVKIPGIEENTEKGIVGTDPWIQKKRNSFNIDMVIRTITLDNGNLLVLLNDLHERVQERPVIKNGKRSVIKERNTFQSEIYLSKEDSDRFFKLTNIEQKPARKNVKKD